MSQMPVSAPPPLPLLTCDEMITLGQPVSELLEALEDDLGPDAVWTLTGAYGGCKLTLPKRKNISRSVAAQSLGEDLVTWLYDRLGPGETRIPMGPHSRSARNMAIFRDAFLKNTPLYRHREGSELPFPHG